MLKSLPGNASTSTIEQGKTVHNEGKIRWLERKYSNIFSENNQLVALLALQSVRPVQRIHWIMYFFNSFLIENI